MLHAHTTFPILLVLLIVSSSSSSINAAPRNTNFFMSLPAQFLAPQNAARATLREPPLIWDTKLADYAQEYANQRRQDCALKHSNGPYGENIFWGSGNAWTPAQAVAAWIAERRWYRYWPNSCARGEQCGHYTQIVWRTSRKVGCARVVCDGGKGVFMICNYDPPGNYIGQKPF